MNKARVSLNLPASLKAAAERYAQRDGVSLNQFISVAVAEKVRAAGAVEFFEKRGTGGKLSGHWHFLRLHRIGRHYPGTSHPAEVLRRSGPGSSLEPDEERRLQAESAGVAEQRPRWWHCQQRNSHVRTSHAASGRCPRRRQGCRSSRPSPPPDCRQRPWDRATARAGCRPAAGWPGSGAGGSPD